MLMILAQAAHTAQGSTEQVSGHNDAMLGGLLMLAIVLAKGIEKLIDWRTEKKREEKREEQAIVTAKLDEEASRMLREASSLGASIAGVVLVKDQNGTPMVYFPRQVGEDTRAIAVALRDLANTHERTLGILERMSNVTEDTNRKLTMINSSGK